jgi:hypothetical protein
MLAKKHLDVDGGAPATTLNHGFHLTAAPVGLWVAGGSLAQPQVNSRPLCQLDISETSSHFPQQVVYSEHEDLSRHVQPATSARQ